MTNNPENPPAQPPEEDNSQSQDQPDSPTEADSTQPPAYDALSFLKMLMGDAFPLTSKTIEGAVDEMKWLGATRWDPDEFSEDKDEDPL